jgi:hypothetical protein
MFNEIRERIEKTNDQRIKMALTIFNIMKNTGGQVELGLRSTVAATMIEMLQTSMIAEDTDLIKLINEGIDAVCNDVRTKYGINDFRSNLKSIIKDSKEQNERISTGEDILKSLNLNNINLN